MLTPRQRIPVDLKGAIAATYSPYLVRSTLRGARAVEVMADDLRVMVAARSAITAEDMELLGWTAAQLTTHGTEARRVAQRDAERKLSSGRSRPSSRAS